MTSADFTALFLMGLLGTGHCLGMCGAFVFAAGGGGTAGARLGRHLVYQAGKALSYAFLALLLTLAGDWLGAGVLPGVQNTLGVIVGLLMIGLGAGYAFEVRWSGRAARWVTEGTVCRGLFAAVQAAGPGRALLIGWLNGFLPCGLSLAAVAYAASFGEPLRAAAGAAVFAAGTVPGLLALALAGGRLFERHRRWLVRVAGAALIVMGLLTLVRGVPAVHDWFHRHTVIPG